MWLARSFNCEPVSEASFMVSSTFPCYLLADYSKSRAAFTATIFA